MKAECMSKTGFVPSIKESELKEGKMKPVRLKDRPILLVRYKILKSCRVIDNQIPLGINTV